MEEESDHSMNSTIKWIIFFPSLAPSFPLLLPPSHPSKSFVFRIWTSKGNRAFLFVHDELDTGTRQK